MSGYDQLINILAFSFLSFQGKRRCHFFAKFADEATGAILSLQRHHSTPLTEIYREGDLDRIRVRLTKYTQVFTVISCILNLTL